MKTGIVLDFPFIRQQADFCNGFLTGQMRDLKLLTALQPIYSLAHKRVIGYEALLRAKNKNKDWISPASLFEQVNSPLEQIHLDRLSRCIHVHNFKLVNDPLNWLFLNVSPETIIRGKAFGSYFNDLLEAFDFPPHRVVIEVVEQPISDNDLLLNTIQYYKEMGCLIAIDDFGAGHSNFDRIWTLKPDIVKLDRSFMVKASTQSNTRSMMSGIVSLIHQAGALALIEGIETMDQALLAIECDADFVQGFFFSRPVTDLAMPLEPFQDFTVLFDSFKAASNRAMNDFRNQICGYDRIFKTAVKDLKSGLPFETSVVRLLTDTRVVRCYQIGVDGIQIGSTLVSDLYTTVSDKRYKPLDDAKSADWFRRHYLQRAIYHPEQLQVTRPYLSISGAHMCVTLSMKFSAGDSESVLCCDLSV